MITDLWIENFKGIGKRQHIPLRPITLLFGANSAGKSTVTHALLYLREVLCRNNPNPTRAIAGAQSMSLGGFENLLHKPGGRQIVVGATVKGWDHAIYDERYYWSEYSAARDERVTQSSAFPSHSCNPGRAFYDFEPPTRILATIERSRLISVTFTCEGTTAAALWDIDQLVDELEPVSRNIRPVSQHPCMWVRPVFPYLRCCTVWTQLWNQFGVRRIH